MENVKLNELKDKAYQCAKDKGFYEKELLASEHIMFIVAEIGEAINAYQEQRFANRVMFEKNIDTQQVNPEEHWKCCFEIFIKDSVEDELADIFIRLLSFLGWLGEDIDEDLDESELSKGMQIISEAKELPSQLYYPLDSLVEYRHSEFALLTLICICCLNNIDLFWHVEQKMKYNEMRPYKHGKKC